MIIARPSEVIFGFGLTDLIVENERAPKKVVENFLARKWQEVAGVKPSKDQRSESDDGDGDEEKDTSSYNNDLVNWHSTLDAETYTRFSLLEDGSVHLIDCDEDEDNRADLLITGDDAKELLPQLKSALELRAKKLASILGSQ